MEIKINDELKNLIPPLSVEEFSQLEHSIINEGCRDAIILWDSTIIDGHNRFEICSKHGIEFNTINKEFSDIEAAKDWMDANQLGRRNLTPDQRKIIIGRRYNREKLRVGEHKGNQYTKLETDQIDHIPTSKRLADENKISAPTVRRYAKEAETFDKIKTEQPELAQRVWSGATTLKDVYREQRKDERKKQNIEISKNNNELPKDKKYRIIYADPPWSYGDELSHRNTGATFHYPTMTIEQLCEMPINEIIEKDSVLFLWVTSPLLEESFDVIKAWGFKYKTSFVWDKVKHNMGHYNSVRHEFLLICTRGSCTPDNKKLFDSVQSIERTQKHSEKPNEFREIIKTIYTHGRAIELFSRTNVDGWDTFGNQV